MPTPIITIAIRKGGSGKTTTAVNLAAALVGMQQRVLLIDLDPQGDASKHLGIKTRRLTRTVNTLFTVSGTNPRDVTIHTDSGVELLPANQDLETTDRSMSAKHVQMLKPIVAALVPSYDYILIDTRPAQSYLTINALIASTHVLVTMQAEYLAMDGLVETFKDINSVRQSLNPQLHVLGILPTLVRSNTRVAQTVLEEIDGEYKRLLFRDPYDGRLITIRDSIKLSEAAYDGQPAISYAPDNEAVKDYIKLAEVIHATN